MPRSYSENRAHRRSTSPHSRSFRAGVYRANAHDSLSPMAQSTSEPMLRRGWPWLDSNPSLRSSETPGSLSIPCIGSHLAMMEGVLILAELIRRFELSRTDEAPLDLLPSFTPGLRQGGSHCCPEKLSAATADPWPSHAQHRSSWQGSTPGHWKGWAKLKVSHAISSPDQRSDSTLCHLCRDAGSNESNHQGHTPVFGLVWTRAVGHVDVMKGGLASLR